MRTWPKKDEVTWEWRKLHNEELYGLYSTPNIKYKYKIIIEIKENEMGGVCGTDGRDKRCIQDFGVKT